MAAGWIVGLAILALIATGWRKTARAAADPARGLDHRHAADGVDVAEVDAPIDRPTPVLRRVWSVVASGALAIWIGAVIATIVGFGVAYSIITLTHMLKR